MLSAEEFARAFDPLVAIARRCDGRGASESSVSLLDKQSALLLPTHEVVYKKISKTLDDASALRHKHIAEPLLLGSQKRSQHSEYDLIKSNGTVSNNRCHNGAEILC